MIPQPTAPDVQIECLPPKLTTGKRFVCWGWVWDFAKQKWKKSGPLRPGSIAAASSTNPNTWGTIEMAVSSMRARKLPGIGRTITKDDPYTYIDLDNCRDPEAGVIDGWAQEHIDKFASYTEITPSWEGVRIVVEGKPPGTRQTKNIPNERPGAKVEIFGSFGRYVTLTGHRLGGATDIFARQEELDALYADLFGDDGTTEGPTRGTYTGAMSPPMSDAQVIDLCRKARNADQFRLLYDDGDDYGDGNRADLAMCGFFAFYTQDRAQIDRLFRDSARYRSKWERASYREPTIDRALTRSDVYTGPTEAKHTLNGGRRISTVRPIATRAVAVVLAPKAVRYAN